MSRSNNPVIVVTGFGPYQKFSKNPSERLTRRLGEQGLDTSETYTLITEIIPVTYNDVNQTVSKLWRTYNPDLMIHIGASPSPKVINLEQQSFRRGYETYDMNAQLPAGQVCPQCGECEDVDTLVSGLNCEKIAEAVSKELPQSIIECKVSHDPGRYLCAYIYFISLSYNKDKTLFIHVPDFDKTTEDVVFDSLKRIIKQCLTQIKKK
uniref:Pyroglutamyl-peptidase I n=1 Tax=Syphacia muris TaxID=451379 RepID=A0A0N5APM0_9BILA